MSAAGLYGRQPIESGFVITASAAAGWIASLAILFVASSNIISKLNIVRHASCVMAFGVIPLMPLTISNFIELSIYPNLIVIALDGLILFLDMHRRLRLFTLPMSDTVTWFLTLEAGGIMSFYVLVLII